MTAASFEFWQTASRAYAALCSLSDPDDWAHELDAVALEAASAVAGGATECRLLDVGAGLGDTIARVSQRMLSSHHISTQLTLIEPAAEARAVCALRFGASSAVGGATVLGSLDELDSGAQFDAISFIHSAYYIDRLSDLVGALRAHLAQTGRLIFVVMSKTSPFFLGRGSLGHRNLAEDLAAELSGLGARVHVLPMTSRLLVPRGLWANAELRGLWIRLYPTARDDDTLERDLASHLVDGIDMRDRIVVADWTD